MRMDSLCFRLRTNKGDSVSIEAEKHPVSSLDAFERHQTQLAGLLTGNKNAVRFLRLSKRLVRLTLTAWQNTVSP